ncbi:transcription factor TFIIIB subunit brf1, partial [Coemansia sp. RSA 2049]
MSKRKAVDTCEISSGSKNSRCYEPVCQECGSTNIITGLSDEYCGDCGTVIESVILTTNYSYESEKTTEGQQYVRLPKRVDANDAASVRIHNSWSQDMIRQAVIRLTGICRQLGLQGIEKRAEFLFVESSKKMMETGAEWVFGRRSNARLAACVYIAGLESGKPVTLVDVAGAVQVSAYTIGHEAKQALAMLEIRLPLLDPLLRVEQAVNRVFGGVIKATCGNAGEKDAMVEQLSGTGSKSATLRTFALRLMEFVSDSEKHRTRVIEVSGQVMAFDQLCSRSTGVNPNTLVCSAVSMGLEHLYVSAPHTSEGMLKRSHREVIFKLVALFNGAGQHTILRHVSATQKALIEAGKIAPWLSDIKLSMDNVAVHLEGILFSYGQAHALLFAVRETRTQESTIDKAVLSGSGNFGSAVSDVVAKISKAPSYVRSEARRERRKNILDRYVSDSEVEPAKWSGACNEDEAQRETRLIWSLYRAGIDREALLSLPLHTLEQIGNESIRSAALNQQDRQRLDTEVVGVDDMAEDE